MQELKPTFFEHLGLADMEKVHSQTLAWIFSEDCKSIPFKSKQKLVRNIFKLDYDFSRIDTITEKDSIDIILKLDNDYWLVIENKIKIGLHSNQLDNYYSKSNKKNDIGRNYFYYLTLFKTTEELPKDANGNEIWQKITYENILNAFEFEKNNFIESTNDYPILISYLQTLYNFYCVFDSFLQNPKKFICFRDTKEQEEIRTEFYEENNYLERFRFIAFAEKLYLMQSIMIINKEYSRKWRLDSPHGNGQIGCCFDDCSDSSKLKYHVAFQKNSIKLWFDTKDDKLRENAIKKALEFTMNGNFGYWNPNTTKNKNPNYNISISKIFKNERTPMNLTYSEFAKVFIEELKIVEEIIKNIIPKIRYINQ